MKEPIVAKFKEPPTPQDPEATTSLLPAAAAADESTNEDPPYKAALERALAKLAALPTCTWCEMTALDCECPPDRTVALALADAYADETQHEELFEAFVERGVDKRAYHSRAMAAENEVAALRATATAWIPVGCIDPSGELHYYTEPRYDGERVVYARRVAAAVPPGEPTP